MGGSDTDSTITVTLGDQQDRVEERVRSGRYASVDDVVRAALHALDREEHEEDAALERKVAQALADPRPSISAEQVFAALRARRVEQAKAADLGA